MKNKKVTYLLILAVAGLWAVIFHRIYAATKEQEENIVDLPQKRQQLFNEVNHQHDQWELDFDYRNPFSAEVIMIREDVISPLAPDKAATLVPKATVRWPEINYLGWIGGVNNAKLALLTVGGKEMMLAEGQQTLGVKLQSIATDSVKVQYEKETRFIKLK